MHEALLGRALQMPAEASAAYQLMPAAAPQSSDAVAAVAAAAVYCKVLALPARRCRPLSASCCPLVMPLLQAQSPAGRVHSPAQQKRAVCGWQQPHLLLQCCIADHWALPGACPGCGYLPTLHPLYGANSGRRCRCLCPTPTAPAPHQVPHTTHSTVVLTAGCCVHLQQRHLLLVVQRCLGEHWFVQSLVLLCRGHVLPAGTCL